MNSHRAQVFLAVLASGIAACHDGLKTPHSDPVPRETYIEASAREICAALAGCCTSRGFGFNAEACDTNVRKLRFQRAAEFCPAPALYDAYAAGNCLAEQKAALSSCALDPIGTSVACRKTCTGTVAAGQTCTNGTDCDRGETGWGFCNPLSAENGICMQFARGKVGDSCKAGYIRSSYGDCGEMASGWQDEGDSVACYSEDGLYCASDLLRNRSTCQPFLGVGQTCKESIYAWRTPQRVVGVIGGSDLLCAPELYCNERQVCAARKGPGAPCTYDEECLDFECSFTSGRCIAAGVQDITVEFCADPV
jgi:hypothetical protein